MKRFTETEKWRDPWFRKLSASAKLAYVFLLDSCDNAGVWQSDFEMAEFQIGTPLDWKAVAAEFGDRIHVFGDGKWVLTRFVAFQYGELRSDCKPHQQVIRLIEHHQIGTVIKGYPKGIQYPQDKDKDKDKDMGGAGGRITAERVYDEYPRKVARQDALKAIAKAAARLESEAILNGHADGFGLLLERTLAYSHATAKWPIDERRFIPHPSTWYNGGRYDDDPATWERGGKAAEQPARVAYADDIPGLPEKER